MIDTLDAMLIRVALRCSGVQLKESHQSEVTKCSVLIKNNNNVSAAPTLSSTALFAPALSAVCVLSQYHTIVSALAQPVWILVQLL